MSTRHRRLTGLVIAGVMSVAAADIVQTQQDTGVRQPAVAAASGPLSQVVREATAPFRDPAAAVAAGYVLSGGCVSGPEQGAMGIHYVNESLVADGLLDATRPEALVYEPRNGRLHLVAVEYIVMAEPWDAAHAHPPVLHGHSFHLIPAPNRGGLPSYYELHVWAWKRNPHGTFADWNPRVQCEDYFVP